MHGIGNDFVMVNAVDQYLMPDQAATLSRSICDRRFGVGSDGLIVAYQAEEGLEMRMWNPDGTESEMCGNGVRCFADFVRREELTEALEIPVQTGAGRLVLQPKGADQNGDLLVRVDMGLARLHPRDIGMAHEVTAERFVDAELPWETATVRATAVSMGNPHLVLFTDDLEGVALEAWGPQLEHHPFFPQRVNVHWVKKLSESHLQMRTWERGAGVTLACGTGACSVAVAGFETGRSGRDVVITLPGGDLRIEYEAGGKVFMTGPATFVYAGEWPLS